MRQTKYTAELLAPIVANSYTMAEVLRKLGRKQGGGFQRHITLLIQKYALDTSHFVGQAWAKGKTADTVASIAKRVRLSDADVLQNNTKWISGVRLRKSLLRAGIEYACSICGISHWHGKELVLQVDHIDGNRGNNEINNLRLVCPNCHSLTATWGNNKRGDLA